MMKKTHLSFISKHREAARPLEWDPSHGKLLVNPHESWKPGDQLPLTPGKGSTSINFHSHEFHPLQFFSEKLVKADKLNHTKQETITKFTFFSNYSHFLEGRKWIWTRNKSGEKCSQMRCNLFSHPKKKKKKTFISPTSSHPRYKPAKVQLMVPELKSRFFVMEKGCIFPTHVWW